MYHDDDDDGAGLDAATRQRLLLEAVPLVNAIAHHTCRRLGGRVERDELVSLGLGIVKDTIVRYDPSRARFSTYLAQRMNWTVLSEVRKRARRRLDPRRGLPVGASLRCADVLPQPIGRVTAVGTRVPSLLEQRDEATMGLVVAGGDLSDAALCQRDNPEESALRGERTRELTRAIDTLPARARTLIERHYLRGERFDDVARDIGISKHAASRLHRRAVTALAHELRKQKDESSPRPRTARYRPRKKS
jgi:RNA polymerase sigma factor (sigma-70 family)